MSFNLFNTRFLSHTVTFLPIIEKKIATLLLNSLSPSETIKANFALTSGSLNDTPIQILGWNYLSRSMPGISYSSGFIITQFLELMLTLRHKTWVEDLNDSAKDWKMWKSFPATLIQLCSFSDDLLQDVNSLRLKVS